MSRDTRAWVATQRTGPPFAVWRVPVRARARERARARVRELLVREREREQKYPQRGLTLLRRLLHPALKKLCV